MKSENKKKKTTNIKDKKTKKATSSDTLDIPTLKKYLDKKIPYFSSFDYDLVLSIFGKKLPEYLNIIDNVIQEKRSDSIICYGNNNQILKVFLDNAISNYSSEINITKIELNGYFDTNEEVLLKDICDNLKIKPKAGYDNYKKALDDYFLKKTQDYSLIVIYCDHIEHLVHKKRQRFLYTLFELVNKSKNILFIGFTYNYNLMDQMEKRIRSRSSQKTIYINIDGFDSVLNGLEKAFDKAFSDDKKENSENEENNEDNENEINSDEDILDEDLGDIGNKFRNCLISEENGDYIIYLQKLVQMGMSIDSILTKIQHHLLLIQIELEKFQKAKATNKISPDELINIIKNITRSIIEKERGGYTYNMLLKLTKLHQTLFICLTSCVSTYSDKVLLSNFYLHFKKITKDYLKQKRSGYDLILIQKYLEDLNNCNLISIKNEEKYGKIYQLKLPLCEIKKILKKLKENNLLDTEMIKLCDDIKWK